MTAPIKPLGPGLALAAAGAIAFSGKAIIVKLAYRHGVDAVTLIMYRMLFALPLFVALAWWAGRGKPPLTRRDLIGVAGLGFTGYYLASFLDFAGLQYITASLERLILYLNPTIVLFLGALRLTGWATSVACILCILQFVLLRPMAAADVAPQVIWLSLLNATLCTLAPVVMVMMAIERVGATLTAQTGMLGPLATIVMGWWLLDEPMNAWIAAGTALVLAGVWLLTRATRSPVR